MILGLGIDVVELDRIREVWQRHGERFVRRILRESEVAYCLSASMTTAPAFWNPEAGASSISA
jgi:holo-[acyl-carrier protein] synthase